VADPLPRGVLTEATRAIIAAADDFGHGDGGGMLVAGRAGDLARAGLLAAFPVIKRSVQRETARHVLALDACAREQAERTRNKGPFLDMDTSLRRLARGEPLPDLPEWAGDHA
jgi:hypothetical protein